MSDERVMSMDIPRKEFAQLYRSGEWTDDDLFKYFADKFGRWCWTEIAKEARKVLSETCMPGLEEDSFIDDCITAAVAQGAEGAFAAVAAALGVDTDDLTLAVANFYEGQDVLPAPIGTDGLNIEIARAKRFHKDLRDGKLD